MLTPVWVKWDIEMNESNLLYCGVRCNFTENLILSSPIHSPSMRIAIVLPGLHRVVRGAEVAFESIAYELAQIEGVRVTLFGSGEVRDSEPYNFVSIKNSPRERFEGWISLPVFRNEYVYEEFTFLPGLIRRYQPRDFDLTVTCSYPFMNWFLRAIGGKQRPAHVFVTQNSDYPAYANQREYRFFSCNGLVCTNPEYFERNKDRWFCTLIPNGVNPKRFSPGQVEREALGVPRDVPIVLMVSALIGSKRVVEGIEAVSQIEDLHLVVCGDGPEREKVNRVGQERMAGRFHWQKLPRDRMPDMYRAADVFLHMSLDEPSANAYIEALATGLPIVTHDRNVTRWTLENTAVLVDATDQAQVIGGIQEAFQRGSPEDIAARRELVERRFAWSKIGRMYYEFFQQVLKQGEQH